MKAVERYFIGIDLHKSLIQICVLDAAGRVLEEKKFRGATFEEGLEAVSYLRRWREGGRLVVEAVGGNRWLVNACREAGLEMVVVDPVKLRLRMLGSKTDRRDAYEMARRLWLGDVERNAATYYPTEGEYAGRKLLRVRHRLVELRQQLVNQIRGLLNAYRIAAPPAPLYSSRNLEKLRKTALPHRDLQSSLEALVGALEAIEGSIEKLKDRILQSQGAEARVVAAMGSLPGTKVQTAATLVLELGDVSRFRNARAAASYAGLVPRVANSADRSHHGPITKRGNPELRWILSEWAVRLMARHPRVRRWAEPMLRRMHKNKVRMALARRLLVGVYVMLRRGEEFSLEKCLAA